MKTIHNKKRNALFLYEILIKQLTKSIIENKEEEKKNIISILKEHFKSGTIIHKEMECYRELLETKDINDLKIAEKILVETKKKYNSINKEDLFNEQSKVIKKINTKINPSIYANFVPNYRSLATIYQIFNSSKLPIKTRVILEENLVQEMIKKENKEEKIYEPIDKLAFKGFIKKFNEQYSTTLIKEQQKLMEKYILGSLDNIEFKLYLNEEVGRLKEAINSSLLMEEVKNDQEMVEKTKQVLSVLEEFKEKECNGDMVGKLLKIQQLVKEIETND